jgi:hypothetical protein
MIGGTVDGAEVNELLLGVLRECGPGTADRFPYGPATEAHKRNPLGPNPSGKVLLD